MMALQDLIKEPQKACKKVKTRLQLESEKMRFAPCTICVCRKLAPAYKDCYIIHCASPVAAQAAKLIA